MTSAHIETAEAGPGLLLVRVFPCGEGNRQVWAEFRVRPDGGLELWDRATEAGLVVVAACRRAAIRSLSKAT